MPRGRVVREAAPPPPKKTNGNGHAHHIGNGPPCPDGHGPLYDWGNGRYFCSHSAHGGNGKFFSDKEVA